MSSYRLGNKPKTRSGIYRLYMKNKLVWTSAEQPTFSDAAEEYVKDVEPLEAKETVDHRISKWAADKNVHWTVEWTQIRRS